MIRIHLKTIKLKLDLKEENGLEIDTALVVIVICLSVLNTLEPPLMWLDQSFVALLIF